MGWLETTNLIYHFYLNHLTPKKETEPRHHVDRFVAVCLVEVDVNYVVGGRSTTDDPLVWHLAGRLKSQSNEQGEKFMDRGSLGVGFFFWSISCQKQKGGGLGGLAR